MIGISEHQSNDCQFHRTVKAKLGNSAKDGILLTCELAEAVGLDPKTVRFYERIGLIAATSHGRIKVYTIDDAKRLFAIRKFRQFGFSISEIRRIKELEGDLTFDELPGATVTEMIVQQMARLKLQLQEMQDTVNEIEACVGILQSDRAVDELH